MADIYSKSYLTVAATRARNSHHGFLYDFPDDTISYNVIAERSRDEGPSEYPTLNATFSINHKYSKGDSSPLDKRAWCLQEWYLPRRIVEFCLHNIRLLCLRRVETRFGRTNDQHTWTRTIARGFGFKEEDFFRTLWENARKDFFYRSLTKVSDRLPAVAGLAQMLESRLQDVPNHRYLAGLWSTRIAEDLSWTVLECDEEAEAMEGVPSWSWASVSAPSDYIYGRPSTTFVDLVEAKCTGYARPRELFASLRLRAFLAQAFLRVDHLVEGYEGRPQLTFWVHEVSARSTTRERVQLIEKTDRTRGVFVSDMPFSPAPHSHEGDEDIRGLRLLKVPTAVRASHKQQLCHVCRDEGYVCAVQLLLLTKTDVSLTALILAPVSASVIERDPSLLQSEEAYLRLGLLEMDCIRKAPQMETTDGHRIPAQDFWKIGEPSARRNVTII